MMPEVHNLRYIVFLIDCRAKDHDGAVFKSIQEAREFAKEYAEDDLYDKAIIGTFVHDGSERQNITSIETFGFKSDKKKVQQLNLFEKYVTNI
jgi:hypothetical protein